MTKRKFPSGPLLAAALSAGLLSGCVATSPVRPVPIPPQRPDAPTEQSDLSARTAAYYAEVQKNFQLRGLMRTDRGTEVRLSADDITRAFLKIALYSEYAEAGGELIPRATASKLQRWEVPVTVNVIVGPAVPRDQAQKDRASVGALVSRLARVSRHPISMTSGQGNFTVLILTEDERLAYGAELNQLMPGLSQAARRAIVSMSPSTYCLVVARDNAGSDAYGQAVAVIRAEHPDLLRESCFHEEITQGLGLANDDPRVRPSIFNDDEEFALLTWLDEVMVRILYDPRLRPGMSEDQARPIVRQIAGELLGGPS